MRLPNFGKKSRINNSMTISDNEEPLTYEGIPSVSKDLDLKKAKDLSMNDVVRALTEQFSNIDADNVRDLSAVGIALSEIPAEMPGLTEMFTSFREEILSSLLFTGDEEKFLSRADKLRGCLDSVSLPEGSGTIEELKLLVNTLVDEAGFDQRDEKSPPDALDDTHGEINQPSAESLLARAERMHEITTAAREYFASDAALNSVLATGGGGVGPSILETALRSLAEASVITVANSLEEQEEQLKIYRNICEQLVKARARMVETQNCLEFLEEGLKGEGALSGLEGTHYQWLSDLVGQFISEQTSYDRIYQEKTEAVTEQISLLQSESDQLSAAVRKLGAETLEPPQSVLQSLTGGGPADVADEGGVLDYEESITQYIEWVTTQRESIRELKKQMARVDQQMLDAETRVNEAFSVKLSSALQKKEETSKRLSDAQRGARKDYEEAEALVGSLTSDADEVLAGVSRLAAARSKFIGDVEDSITTTMIKLGEVLHEGNARAHIDDED